MPYTINTICVLHLRYCSIWHVRAAFGPVSYTHLLFGEEPKILATIEKDVSKSYEEGLIELYKKLRPGEPPTVESSESLLRGMFFDPKRYDLHLSLIHI